MIKQSFTIILATAILSSCGGGDKKSTTTEPEKNDVASSKEYQEGLELVAQSDCLTCHKIAAASTGPSYESSAAKYTNDAETIKALADKIVNGGVGVWGQVPMSAHPALSKTDAEKMVKYILLLKK